jgi:hypothetical protein
MTWYLRACPHCNGDLHDTDDPGWAECLQCARIYRVGAAIAGERRPQLVHFEARVPKRVRRHPAAARREAA